MSALVMGPRSRLPAVGRVTAEPFAKKSWTVWTPVLVRHGQTFEPTAGLPAEPFPRP